MQIVYCNCVVSLFFFEIEIDVPFSHETFLFFLALSALQKALHAGAVVGLMHAYGDSGANLNSDEFTARKNGITVSYLCSAPNVCKVGLAKKLRSGQNC